MACGDTYCAAVPSGSTRLRNFFGFFFFFVFCVLFDGRFVIVIDQTPRGFSRPHSDGDHGYDVPVELVHHSFYTRPHAIMPPGRAKRCDPRPVRRKLHGRRCRHNQLHRDNIATGGIVVAYECVCEEDVFKCYYVCVNLRMRIIVINPSGGRFTDFTSTPAPPGGDRARGNIVFCY